MAEGNAVNIRQPRLKSSTWEATKTAYDSIITQEERDSGYIPATFQANLLHMSKNLWSIKNQELLPVTLY